MVDEDDEELTTIHSGEPGLPRVGTKTEGTVRHGAPRAATPREETVVLATDAPARPQLRPSDSGWGTVVLPGGGHPAHVADRTQRLAVPEPDRAPEPIPASPSPFRSLGPDAWAIPRLGLTSPPTRPATGAAGGPATVPIVSPTPASPSPLPTGGHPLASPPTGGPPVVPISGGHPIVSSGAHALVPPTPTGGHPIVSRTTPRVRGRAPARSAGPTGAHAGLRPAPSDDSRLAWGFLLGVLITVAIVSVAVALALYLLG